jgi:hypothetical protein
MMEDLNGCETPVGFYQATMSSIPEDSYLCIKDVQNSR